MEKVYDSFVMRRVNQVVKESMREEMRSRIAAIVARVTAAGKRIAAEQRLVEAHRLLEEKRLAEAEVHRRRGPSATQVKRRRHRAKVISIR